MNQPELGKKIAELRKAKGLTQEELVEKCNLSVRTLQRIESGEGSPRSYTIRIIFDALDYSQIDSNEIGSNKIGSVISFRLEQFYRYFIDLFNLKTNTMKKITILSLALSCIVLGLFTLVTKSDAQNKPIQVQEKIENKTSSDKIVSNGYVSCESSFQENDELIGCGVKFNKNGVNVNVRLMKLNTNTGRFNVGFVKGYFQSSQVEAYSPKAWIDKGTLNFEANDSIVYKENNSQIILYGKAKLTSTKNEFIEANKIIIHIE